MAVKHIKLKDRAIAVHLRRNRRSKHLRVLLRRDGSLLVTAPERMPQFFVTRFIASRADWIIKKIDQAAKEGLLKTPDESRRDFEAHRRAARNFVEECISNFNQIYKFNFKKITIRDQSSRWGSCSERGNLSFNYRLVLLPRHLAEYVVVHELCHLKEMNHSAKFWSLVARTVPEYQKYREELRKTGRYL